MTTTTPRTIWRDGRAWTIEQLPRQRAHRTDLSQVQRPARHRPNIHPTTMSTAPDIITRDGEAVRVRHSEAAERTALRQRAYARSGGERLIDPATGRWLHGPVLPPYPVDVVGQRVSTAPERLSPAAAETVARVLVGGETLDSLLSVPARTVRRRRSRKTDSEIRDALATSADRGW